MDLRSCPYRELLLFWKQDIGVYAGHLRLPCFFVQSWQWQEYQVLPSALMEAFSHLK